MTWKTNWHSKNMTWIIIHDSHIILFSFFSIHVTFHLQRFQQFFPHWKSWEFLRLRLRGPPLRGPPAHAGPAAPRGREEASGAGRLAGFAGGPGSLFLVLVHEGPGKWTIWSWPFFWFMIRIMDNFRSRWRPIIERYFVKMSEINSTG